VNKFFKGRGLESFISTVAFLQYMTLVSWQSCSVMLLGIFYRAKAFSIGGRGRLEHYPT